MCIEESSDTIFNMGCGGGGRTAPAPPPWIIGRENRPWTRGLTLFSIGGFLGFCPTRGLKILELSKLFVADASMKKKNQQISFYNLSEFF